MQRNRDTKYKVLSNEWIGVNTRMMMLEGATDEFTAPGQFVNIAVPGFTLRRPISVCDIEGDILTIVYDVVGHGTEALGKMKADDVLDLLPALGNGFDLSKCGERPVLLGGGVGCPPIYSLAKTMIANDILPTVILGFNSDDRMIMIEQFENLDIPFYVSTVDGSYGTRGYVTDVIREEGLDPDCYYACGPLPMLRALTTQFTIPGQVSLEARMACGFGVCMCCSLQTKDGARRICKDGPVFDASQLVWK